jgi:hypothetical protein
MTAINIIRADESAVHVVTDGAHWLADGTVSGFAPKVYPVPHLSMAICGRGEAERIRVTGEQLVMRSESFDAAVGLAGRCLPAVRDACRGNPMELFLVGWSDRHRQFDVVVLDTRCGLTRYDGEAVIGPAVADVRIADPSDDARFCASLVDLVHRQRLVKSGHSLAGGFVQLTTITRGQVVQRILHRWPDEIGKRIEVAPERVAA